jgi:hypothetical protein
MQISVGVLAGTFVSLPKHRKNTGKTLEKHWKNTGKTLEKTGIKRKISGF